MSGTITWSIKSIRRRTLESEELRKKFEKEKAALARRMDDVNADLNFRMSAMLEKEKESSLKEAEVLKEKIENEKRELQASMLLGNSYQDKSKSLCSVLND